MFSGYIASAMAKTVFCKAENGIALYLKNKFDLRSFILCRSYV